MEKISIKLSDAVKLVENGEIKTSGWNLPKDSLVVVDCNKNEIVQINGDGFTSVFLKVSNAVNDKGKQLFVSQIKLNATSIQALANTKKDKLQLTFKSVEWTYEGKTGTKAELDSIKE